MMTKFMNKIGYTHFLSLPFIRKQYRDQIQNIQKTIYQHLQKVIDSQHLRKASKMLAHLTISMLSITNSQSKSIVVQVLNQHKDLCLNLLKFTQLTFPKLGYYTRYNYQTELQEVSVIYLEVSRDSNIEKVNKVIDQLIRKLLQHNIIKKQELKSLKIRFNDQTQTYENNSYHLTLFRLQSTANNQAFRESFEKIQQKFKAVKFQVDYIDLSTRFEFDETKFYNPLARIALNSL